MEKGYGLGNWVQRSVFALLIISISCIVLQRRAEAAPVPTAAIQQTEMTIKEGDVLPLTVLIEMQSFINDMQSQSVSAVIQNLRFFTQNCGGYNQVVSSAAKPDEDYVTMNSASCASQTLSFTCDVEPGSTQSFYINSLIRTVEDQLPEAEECFKVCIKSVNNALVNVDPSRSCAQVKVVDDEPKLTSVKPVEVKRSPLASLPLADNNSCSFVGKPCVYFTKNQPVVVNESALYADLPLLIDNRIPGETIDGIKINYYVAPDPIDTYAPALLGADFFLTDDSIFGGSYIHAKDLSNVEIKGGESYQTAVRISINRDSLPEQTETLKICLDSSVANYQVGTEHDSYRGWCSSLVIVDND